MARVGTFSIETELKPIMKFLDGIADDKYTVKNIMKGVGSSARKQVKKNYFANGLHKQSGNLYRSVKSWVEDNGKSAVVAPKRKRYTKEEYLQGARGYKLDISYGFILAHGATIRPRNKKYLTFQIDGKWVKMKETRIQPRNWVEKPIDRYLASAGYRMRLEELTQRQITRLEKKYGDGR